MGLDIGVLLLRVVLGGTFAYHGAEKVGLVGEEGLEGATRFFARQGFHPPRAMAVVAAATELSAATGLLLGLLTPLAAAALVGVTVNIGSLHARNGFSRKRNGVEYELVLAGIAAALAFTGGGSWSVDRLLGLDLGGTIHGAAAVGLGVVMGLGVAASRRAAPLEELPHPRKAS